MRKIFNKKMILSAFILAGFSVNGISSSNGLNNMSDQEKKEFVESLDPEMVNYLIKNPEILIKAVENSNS
jgi:uncharacterized protein YaaW (UPF0174 family)